MKRELNVYNFISGIGEYDDWSYCADEAMWYEDKQESFRCQKTNLKS